MQINDWNSTDGAPEATSVPALSILYHPDFGRIGDRVVLGELLLGAPVALSRDTPAFAPPSSDRALPLADAFISRTPIAIEPIAGGGLRLRRGESRTRVEWRGANVPGDLTLSAAEIDRGAVLRLGGTTVLLVHRALPGLPPIGDTFGLVGESDGIRITRRDIQRVADLDVPILLRGETGTGKELVARAVHRAGRRRAGPFVAVNLAAIAPELGASELFGAERGAFTGAVKQQQGYFSAARGGTLFLDEIGEAPPALQVMLLRALETGEIQRVGAARAETADVRVIAATDADLEAKIQDGSFRAPLLHRLAASEIRLPPLRERRDDIGRLLASFLRDELERIGEAHRLTAAPPERPWLPPSLVARLADLDWPGNVRQLQNVARQIVISGRGRDRVEIEPALERLLAQPAATPRPPQPPSSPAAKDRRKPAEISDAEIAAALRASRWDLVATAEALRISRASLYLLIQRSTKLRTAGDLTPDEIIACHRACGGDLNQMVDRLEVSEKALRRRLRELGLDCH